MADGKSHSSISIGAAIGFGIGYASGYVVYPDEVPIVALGILAGTILTPDHDVDDYNISHHLVSRIFGNLGKQYWYHLWRPYSLAIPHRSIISHLPILGTLYRLIYLLFPVTIVPLSFIARDNPLISIASRSVLSQLLAMPFLLLVVVLYLSGVDIKYVMSLFGGGLMVSDLLHWIFDYLL